MMATPPCVWDLLLYSDKNGEEKTSGESKELTRQIGLSDFREPLPAEEGERIISAELQNLMLDQSIDGMKELPNWNSDLTNP